MIIFQNYRPIFRPENRLKEILLRSYSRKRPEDNTNKNLLEDYLSTKVQKKTSQYTQIVKSNPCSSFC